MVGLIVLYSLRGFERQMGSKKFGAYLIYSLLSSTVLSILFVLILNVMMGWLSFVPSSGPFFLIYSLMIFYYCKSSRLQFSINSYLFIVYNPNSMILCITHISLTLSLLFSLFLFLSCSLSHFRACPRPVSDPILRSGSPAIREELDLPVVCSATVLRQLVQYTCQCIGSDRWLCVPERSLPCAELSLTCFG